MTFCKKHIFSCCVMAGLLCLLSACGKENTGQEMFPELTTQTESSQEQQTESGIPEQEENSMQTTEQTVFGSEEKDSKILIVYFSLTDIIPDGADAVTHATPSIGNTEYAAMEIQKQTGGDLFAIKTVENYPVSHSECSAIAEEEMRSDARPELSTHVENMEDYEIVYIGFPIWWYQEPMAVRTFLEEYDFSGKTIIPFCTTLGAGVEESEENIKSLCPDAVVLDGLTLHTGRDSFHEPVTEWLVEIGMIEE